MPVYSTFAHCSARTEHLSCQFLSLVKGLAVAAFAAVAARLYYKFKAALTVPVKMQVHPVALTVAVKVQVQFCPCQICRPVKNCHRSSSRTCTAESGRCIVLREQSWPRLETNRASSYYVLLSQWAHPCCPWDHLHRSQLHHQCNQPECQCRVLHCLCE